ncbi:hypothetical protein BDB00DRAFT_859373 [Zychaea mexicana]|uniref:uncharacterized protein n=1 Tax=Zychaea mexicana TaxID=64656 RepID=UPI0022FE32F2|nr:uncharacterized protein BDB00DRAFT_859373 [Zychaea mexicana]KAI9477145.1 hypothetical protein BDB00DRAFT_859373 [Zychaea mexicana]
MTKIEKTLLGKVAVITGGSRGFGAAVAEAVIERGGKVAIGDILIKEGESTAENFNAAAAAKVAAFIQCDVTSYKDNIALFQFAEKEFGGVDIAFLNAGIGGKASDIAFLPPDDELDAKCMDVNGTSVIKGTKIAILHMAKKGGVIVNTASILGTHTLPSTAAYSASKHAVVGWTRSFNLLPQVCGIRVNAVCPHFVDTDLIAIKNPEIIAKGGPMLQLIPKINKATVSTVVKAVLTLIEDESRNAQTLLALPGDVIRVEEPPPPLMEGVTPQFKEDYKQYERDYVSYYKKQLKTSLEVYQKDHHCA